MKAVALLLAVAVLTAATSGCVGEVRRAPLGTPAPLRGESPRWPSLPVAYCLDLSQGGYADEPTFTRLVARAFEAWGVPVQDRGRCDGAMKDDDGRNQIGWGVPPNLAPEGPGVYEAGFTRVRFRSCLVRCPPGADADLVEADIIIDRDPPRAFRNERCLYSVLLHELGHFMGLGHLSPPAIMAAASSFCPQNLTAADLEALRQRYGDDLTRR